MDIFYGKRVKSGKDTERGRTLVEKILITQIVSVISDIFQIWGFVTLSIIAEEDCVGSAVVHYLLSAMFFCQEGT